MSRARPRASRAGTLPRAVPRHLCSSPKNCCQALKPQHVGPWAWLLCAAPSAAVSPLAGGEEARGAEQRGPPRAGGRFPAARCVLQTLPCVSLALSPPLPARLEMKMAPLFLSPGPNCEERAAPETPRCTRGAGRRDRAGGPTETPRRVQER